MSISDWQLLKSLAPWTCGILAAIGEAESHFGKDGTPGGPSSREWVFNYGYEDNQVLSQYRGFKEQIIAVNAFVCAHMVPILPVTEARIMVLAEAWGADNPQQWGANVWSIFSTTVNDYDNPTGGTSVSIHDIVRDHLKTRPRTFNGHSLHLLPSRQEHIDALPKLHEQIALKSYADLPESVDLSPIILAKMATLDQGALGTCPAQALAYLDDKYGISNGHFPGAPGVSRSFNYRLAKNPASAAYDGDAGDAGTDLMHIFQTSTDYGFVPEELDPYSALTSDVNCAMPSAAALTAAGNKLTGTTAVFSLTDPNRSININAAMNLLANGQTFPIGILVVQNFMAPTLQPDGTYVVALPSGTIEGAHAICIVGYRKPADGGVQFLFINSWGADWPAAGMNGLCYLAEGWPTYTYDPIGNGTQTFGLMEGLTASDTAVPQPAPTPTPTPTPAPTPATGVVTLQVGNPIMYVDGVAEKLLVPPVNLNGRVMIPVRDAGEALGATVAWDQVTETVTLTPAATAAELAAEKAAHTVDKAALDAANAKLAKIKADFL